MAWRIRVDFLNFREVLVSHNRGIYWSFSLSLFYFLTILELTEHSLTQHGLCYCCCWLRLFLLHTVGWKTLQRKQPQCHVWKQTHMSTLVHVGESVSLNKMLVIKLRNEVFWRLPHSPFWHFFVGGGNKQKPVGPIHSVTHCDCHRQSQCCHWPLLTHLLTYTLLIYLNFELFIWLSSLYSYTSLLI